MKKGLIFLIPFCLIPAMAWAAPAAGFGSALFGIRIEFIIFALTLLGVAMFHLRTMQVALCGLATILLFKLGFTSFNLVAHLGLEWRTLLNLFGLLMGFAILARHFEESRLPELLPTWLPSGWPGGCILLWMVFVLSSFLDNIAAAMIGGTIAMVVFRGKVHIAIWRPSWRPATRAAREASSAIPPRP